MWLTMWMACWFDVTLTDTADSGAPDCTEYTFHDETYDCSDLDRCDFSQENVPLRLACCDCDPRLCDAVPTCPSTGGSAG